MQQSGSNIRNCRRLKPACGRGRCGRRAAATHALTTARQLSGRSDDIHHTARSALLTAQRERETEVDARNRCGRFPANAVEQRCARPRAGIRRRRSVAVLSRVTAAMSMAGVFGWPPTCACADMSSEIERRDSTTRVRARSVSDESTLTVLAAGGRWSCELRGGCEHERRDFRRTRREPDRIHRPCSLVRGNEVQV